MNKRFTALCSQSAACSRTSARWRCPRTARSRARRSTRPNQRTSWVSYSTSLTRTMPTTSLSRPIRLVPTSKSSMIRARLLSASTRRCNSRLRVFRTTRRLPNNLLSAQASWSLLPIRLARSVVTMRSQKRIPNRQLTVPRQPSRSLMRRMLRCWRSKSQPRAVTLRCSRSQPSPKMSL